MKKNQHSYKKAAITTVASGLVVSLAAPYAQAAPTFTDVPSRYTDAVNYLIRENITIGTTEEKFGTQLPIKRVDAAIMLAKALKLGTNNVPASGFSDVPGRAEPFVAALKEAGIVQGKSNNQFGSQQNITRGEAALMLAQAYRIGSSNQDNVKFTDVPDRYWEAVDALLANGITTGKTATTFGTSDDITRGEFAIFLYRISEFPVNDDGSGSGGVDDGDGSDSGGGTGGDNGGGTGGDNGGGTGGDNGGGTGGDNGGGTGGDNGGGTGGDNGGESGGDNGGGSGGDNGGGSGGDNGGGTGGDSGGGSGGDNGDGTGGGPITVSDLQDLIDRVGNYDESYYTEETWQNLEEALEAAEGVAGNTEAVQSEIDQAAEDLTTAIDDLVLEPISYTTGPDETSNGVVLTFTDSVGEDGAVDPVEGTIADAEVTLGTDGTTLTLETEEGAEPGETAEFDLNVGGTEVEVDLTWDGTEWDVETIPADVFEEITAGESEIDGVVDLDLLNDGLLDGSISLDDLLSNSDLLRLNLLPGSAVAAGDVISIRNGDFDVLTVELTEDHIEDGFVNLGLSTDVIRALAGEGGVIDLTAIVDRGEGDTVTGTIGSIQLPDLPIVEPVIDLAEGAVEDLLYILSGERPLRINIEGNEFQDIEAGSTLELTINGAEEDTVTHIITEAEIEQGFINYTFDDEDLLTRLLTGLTVGTDITITPEITSGEEVFTGDTATVEVTEGLLEQVGNLLDDLLRDVINLELLNDGLQDGSVPVDELVDNPDLLRVTLLEEGGLEAGDVISISAGDLNVLSVTLTESDITNGFVDLGLSTDVISALAGDGPVDLTAVVDRGEDGTLTGTIGSIQLPELPLVEPVVDLVDSTVQDVLYILSGEQPLRVNLDANALQEDAVAGSTLEVTIDGAEEETLVHTITEADIEQGFVEYTIDDEGLVARLLNGLTVGSDITITPEITSGDQVSTGDPATIEVTTGLLEGLLDGGLLGEGSLVDGVLDGIIGDGGLINIRL
ncbi:S-layer homology domain-containing protein [Domibacillus robiginosus]|uniref:S-layer homology domain-containing protein n=1 Tax=Domibacillus robiginosus TaxID=1071054 RepID=UPI0009E3136E|nr:S-layer homology domain-containing protein [Domibacillus robiginosus]